MSQIPELLAMKILLTAIAEKRAGELLECLFNGGSCTLDAQDGHLVLISGDMIDQATAEANR